MIRILYIPSLQTKSVLNFGFTIRQTLFPFPRIISHILKKIFRYQIGRVNEAAFYTRIGTNLGVNCPLKRASRH